MDSHTELATRSDSAPAVGAKKSAVGISLAIIVWVFAVSWGFTKWFGRVCLWLLFFPLGLWRSINHGSNKRQKKQLAAMQEMHTQSLEVQKAALAQQAALQQQLVQQQIAAPPRPQELGSA